MVFDEETQVQGEESTTPAEGGVAPDAATTPEVPATEGGGEGAPATE
tara:strand:+ start:5772 stop:5912 length:141 start_codon:yes stop_codon:yes gene_type:complete